jgi:hypothetical protein
MWLYSRKHTKSNKNETTGKDMRLIAHRGHTKGINPSTKLCENLPAYIQNAVDAGFDVEIDIWHDEGEFFLGHDLPQYPIELRQIEKWAKKVFVFAHCKNVKAAIRTPFEYGLIPFAHSEDPFIILPDMHLWVHPKEIDNIPFSVKKECIIVDGGNFRYDALDFFGVCTDNPEDYKMEFNI